MIGGSAADSGSRDANGISYDLEGAADIALAVTGNIVRHTDTQGIFVQSVRFPAGTPNAGPTVDLTLRDNSVSEHRRQQRVPVRLPIRHSDRGPAQLDMCLDIAGNTSTGVGGAEHFRVRQRDASTFNLERYSGSGTDDAAVAAFLAAQNAAGSTGSATHATTFGGVADGTCQSP